MLVRLLARLRSLWLGVVHRSRFESEMAEEFRHHIEARAADLRRSGLSRKEARRRAHLEFGHEEAHKEAARASRGLRPFDRLRFSWIDVRLGARMLVKYPGLTIAAVFALAVGIPVGMAPMHLSSALDAPLPEDGENRVRAIRLWDPARTSVAPLTDHDWLLLEQQLGAFDLAGAFRRSTYNLDSDGRAAPVAGAEVTSSIFALLGTAPLLGRTLDRSDEAAGSPPVVVLGHDLWRARFGGDPAVVGRTVRLAGVPHTVVGVMPQGFLFPANEQAWLPLRAERSAPGEGRALYVVGRLAEGVTDEQAQAELTTLAGRRTPDVPEARARLRFEVVPFAYAFLGIPRGGLAALPEFPLFQALALGLLVVASGNVAMLVFARTATRLPELAVRTALGAGRGRIVAQIFVETLVLAAVAAGVGLASADWILGRVGLAALAGEAALPYWLSLGVTPRAVLRALGLAVLGAAVAGLLPALRLSGRDPQQSIRRARGGRSGILFGRLTGALVVADVAVSIVAVGLAAGLSKQLTSRRSAAELTGIAAGEFLAVDVRLPVDALPGVTGAEGARFRERLARTQEALVERLLSEPGVRSVAVADALPRMDHDVRLIEVERAPGPAGAVEGHGVRVAHVDPAFFGALRQPVLAGRGFDRADLATDPRPVVVNSAFAESVLGGRDPVGQRVRFVGAGAGPEAPWVEIVGVVGHLGMNIVNPRGSPGVYLPAAPGEIHPLRLAVELGADPARFAPRAREIVSEVEPSAFVRSVTALDRVYQGDWYLMLAISGGLVLFVAVLVALATSALYAILSFSVSERTREIGIRAALGAGRPSLALTILRRSLGWIALGALLGTPLAAWILLRFREIAGAAGSAGLTVGLAVGLGLAIVSLVALAGCLAPTRRALAVPPSRALKAEG